MMRGKSDLGGKAAAVMLRQMVSSVPMMRAPSFVLSYAIFCAEAVSDTAARANRNNFFIVV